MKSIENRLSRLEDAQKNMVGIFTFSDGTVRKVRGTRIGKLLESEQAAEITGVEWVCSKNENRLIPEIIKRMIETKCSFFEAGLDVVGVVPNRDINDFMQEK